MTESDAAILERDVTSSGLLALVISNLRLEAPDLLPEEIDLPDCALAHAPARIKRGLLEAAYKARGAGFIIGMGQRIKHVGFDPVMHVMLRSASPAVLAAKFQRFEQFTHMRHRTSLDMEGEEALIVRRTATYGPKPGAAENLLIAGLMKAMLEEIGCRDVAVAAGNEPYERILISWSAHMTDRAELPTAAAPTNCRDQLKVYGADETKPTVRRVVRHLTGDISRNWSCAEMAAALGLSARTLQRRLKDEETSLSEIVRAVRTREACQLLTDSDFKLTEIGYWCGFSDSPHFSREFRRALGVPPALYRQTAA